MRGRNLWRRLAVGAATTTLALGGTLTTSAPAQAQQAENAQAAFLDACDSTFVLFTSDLALDWFIRVDGADFWPQPGDQQPAPGEVGTVRVPNDADLIRVNYQGSTSDWPVDHTWIDPEGECDFIPDELTVSQPTCDVAAGEITIPEFGERWLLDGEAVESGLTRQAVPGIHVVELLGLFRLEDFLDDREGEVFLPGKTYLIDILTPDCPDEDGDGGSNDKDGDSGDGDGPGDMDGADGSGGELPKTGVPAAVLVGAAVLSLLVGGVLYLVGRRRSVTAD